ncbi:MAG: phage Gp37/Gp68 family protein [Methanophagales archaeon]|nr:phage Gp37/Gp68 family protein [Methanophagales archaeon]
MEAAMQYSKIEWTETTWNPVTGCTKVSPGCAHCYAERMARRLAGRCGYPADKPFKVTLHPERLDAPLRWKKPKRVFVCSMSDPFHKDIPDYFRIQMWRTMEKAYWHTFLVLTKRPQNALLWFHQIHNSDFGEWPPILNNIWLGVTAENQQTADERIPLLLQIPAAVRFVSCEPLLGPIDLGMYLHHGISWCIVGAESGPGARLMDENWVRRLVTQCKQSQVPVFYKQKIVNGKKMSLPMLDGKQYVEFPPTIHRPNVR